MALWRFEAIGTQWEIETDHPLPDARRRALLRVVDDFDADWSRFRADSVVSSVRGGGTAALPRDAAAMLGALREVSDATFGAVTPLVGAGLEALGYDAALTLQPGRPRPAPADWTRILRWDDGALTLTEPAVIDVGALGKGRLVDLLSQALTDVDGTVTVDGSGDLRVRGGTARVALQHPYDHSSAIGVVEVTDAALCASATDRRAWGDGLHHVLDGRTGLPVRTWAATWVLAADAMQADALATALFFDGGIELAECWGAQWVRMSTEGRIERSRDLAGELFLA